jgi:hypothetical protein
VSHQQPKRPTNLGCVILALGLLVVVVAIIVGAAANTATSTRTGAASGSADQAISLEAPTSEPRPTTAQSGPVTSFGGDGTYVVGTDIVAGTYNTVGTGDNIVGCYWERLRNTSGDSSAIIALDYTHGPATVTISRSDGAFKTSGCQQWHKVS